MTLYGIDRNWKQDALIGLGAGIGFIVINSVSGQITLGLPAVPMTTQQFFNLAIVVVAAPILEEGMFRGVIPAFLTQLGTKFKLLNMFWVVCVIQALLFAWYHYSAYGAGFQTAFVGAALFGVVAYLLVRSTKSLLPSIMMHAMFNGYLWFMQNVGVGG